MTQNFKSLYPQYSPVYSNDRLVKMVSVQLLKCLKFYHNKYFYTMNFNIPLLVIFFNYFDFFLLQKYLTVLLFRQQKVSTFEIINQFYKLSTTKCFSPHRGPRLFRTLYEKNSEKKRRDKIIFYKLKLMFFNKLTLLYAYNLICKYLFIYLFKILF